MASSIECCIAAPSVVQNCVLMTQFVTRDGVNGRDIAGVNWGFDAYGGMNDEHELDDDIARCICKQADIDVIEGPMVLEAGSIHVDGEGYVLLLCPTHGM